MATNRIESLLDRWSSVNRETQEFVAAQQPQPQQPQQQGVGESSAPSSTSIPVSSLASTSDPSGTSGSQVTLGAFCRDWLEAHRVGVSPSTCLMYEFVIRRLTDHFGADRRLRDIGPRDAEVFIAQQVKIAKGYEGQPLSDWSREQIKGYAKVIFRAAVTWGLLDRNPFDVLRSRKLATKRWHRVTVAQYHALLAVAPTLRCKVFYALAYTSGARSGELLALRWDDVDFDSGKIIIASREGTETMPPFHVKDHEMRTVPLPAHTLQLLAEWRTQALAGVPYVLLDPQRYERVRAKWQQLRREGKPWSSRYMTNNILRNFKVHCRLAGINPVGKLTVHTLRKCCGQNWADAGLPINVVQKLMGHSKPETTLTFYSQVDALHERKAAESIQAMLMAPQTQPLPAPRKTAGEWLKSYLGYGMEQVPHQDTAANIKAAATVQGFEWGTVEKAASAMGIIKFRVENHWEWKLPPAPEAH